MIIQPYTGFSPTVNKKGTLKRRIRGAANRFRQKTAPHPRRPSGLPGPDCGRHCLAPGACNRRKKNDRDPPSRRAGRHRLRHRRSKSSARKFSAVLQGVVPFLRQRGLPGHETVTMPIGMDDHVDEIRIVEGFGRLCVGLLIEVPGGGPKPPQQLAEIPAIFRQPGSAAFGVKIILIPITVFIFRRPGLDRTRNVVDVVAAGGYEPDHAFRLKNRGDAPSAPSPQSNPASTALVIASASISAIRS